jgi:hypothetical protein
MIMPTDGDPFEIVNFGDNGNPKSGEAGKPRRSAVPFWIARRYRDGRAQTLGNQLAGGHNLWSLVWYDESVAEDRLAGHPYLWHSDLDWMVARTGFAADDLVVAMRSGGPANHEHADRNSIIVKCFGEQLVTDPYRPPYSFSDPSWMMRTTEGHSAVLVDGQPHQYHDGMEGTNPSDASANVIQAGERADFAFWTSDATEAYALVDPDLSWVGRTVVVLYESRAVLVVDRVETNGRSVDLSARFFGYNLDGRGGVRSEGTEFALTRPGATLYAASVSPSGTSASTGRLPIPDDRAEQHPFVEVQTLDSSPIQTIVTLLRPVPAGGEPPTFAFAEGDSGLIATSGKVRLEINHLPRIPRIGVL